MPVRLTSLPLDGLLLVEAAVHRDERGLFVERYNREEFLAAGFPERDFVQDNQSRSAPGVLRGIHFQRSPPQGKLVTATSGRAWDVAVDLRMASPTFGQHYGVELSGDSGLALWIPAGFGHGFCVLGDQPCDLYYKVDCRWAASGEGGVHFADPDLGIAWPVRHPVLSPRDRRLPSLRDLRRGG